MIKTAPERVVGKVDRKGSLYRVAVDLFEVIPLTEYFLVLEARMMIHHMQRKVRDVAV